MQGLKGDGGFGLVDIRTKDRALKLQWVARLAFNEELRQLAYVDLHNRLGDLIWKINLNVKELALLDFLEPSFWLEVLKLWLKHTHEQPNSSYQVREEVIWFNSYIRIEGRPFFLPEWLEKGITKIGDLLDETNNFLTFSELKEKFAIPGHFTKLWGIIDAILLHWICLLPTVEDNNQKQFYKWVKTTLKPARSLYVNFTQNPSLLTKTLTKWQ